MAELTMKEHNSAGRDTGIRMAAIIQASSLKCDHRREALEVLETFYRKSAKSHSNRADMWYTSAEEDSKNLNMYAECEGVADGIKAQIKADKEDLK